MDRNKDLYVETARKYGSHETEPCLKGSVSFLISTSHSLYGKKCLASFQEARTRAIDDSLVPTSS